jgi:hypothetical protein
MLPYRDSKLTKIVLGIFFVIILLYAFYEGHGILFGPSIEVSGRAMIVHQPYIEIKGAAQRIASLAMNGQDIPVTEDGSFDQPYVLSPGYNRIVLDAKDKYGKSTQRVIEIVYEASSTSATSTTTSAATSTASTSTPTVAQ